MVDLRAMPYYLDDEGVRWVEDTIGSMTDEEKIGQLFVNMGASRTEEYLTDVVSRYRFGAVRYNPGTAAQVHEQNRILQESSKIPLLIASNAEAGGNGACTDGTMVGHAIKLGATDDPRYAYEMGRVSGVESSAIGCNWAFAPVVDLLVNWRNPIISNRAFGSDADLVLAMAKEYLRGMDESGVACAMKHFPGDGIDERDHHLSSSVNSLSTQEWDETFGKVYAGMIEAGVHSVMVGHIMLPAYQRHFAPGLADRDLLPASLSKEITTDLLKGRLGFNGLVVTDASHMVGLTAAMRRRDLVPQAIAAGCDLFLFYNDPEEDLGFMMDGYRNGVITQERLTDALRAILGLKASRGLHTKDKKDIVPPAAEALARIGLPENKALFAEVADRAITLVKNVDETILPVTPERYPRILVIPVKGPENPAAAIFGGGGAHPAGEVAERLRAAGHEVEVFESAMDKLLKLPEEERMAGIASMYSGKAPIAGLTDRYDLILNVAKVVGGMQPVERVSWPASKGTPDLPWYVHEVPTIFVSVAAPFHLADAPAVKCFINTYDALAPTLDALVAKLAVGAEAFTGVSPVDAFCGLVDTRL
ncbi:MAG TPA: glycoside hydrolase family 3 N-terminal domain-containing protein [Actinotalea sp.]|nr:glycoside hydrolase family 3 N-terminal domain-containing protein [Actinotalea sp.]